LINALKFRSGRPPEIKISGKVRDNGEGEILTILVEDNGIGFEEKYLDRIFTPFQRLHVHGEYEGNGIGLAICRKVVETLGGSITAESRPGEGSTFIINLPVKNRSRSKSTELDYFVTNPFRIA
jgi:light-regulated signal transduction histidine kinase (bacteriophytochrome)